MINLNLEFNLFNESYYIYERLLVLLFSLVPTILLVCFVLFTDRKSKEPKKSIVICLLSGILTIALSGYLENLVMPYIYSSTVLTYVWAFIEEFAKISIFYLFIFDNKHYDDIYDGLVYMTLIALSFAGLENIMYAFSESTVSDSINLALIRDFTTVPLHVICGIVIGHFISLGNFSKQKKKKRINYFLALVIPSLIHGTYNLLMGIIGGININYENLVHVLFFVTLPLLLIMVALFYIAIRVTIRTLTLNKIFINRGTFSEKYSYLMNYEEYRNSNSRMKRLKMYDKTNFRKKGENDA